MARANYQRAKQMYPSILMGEKQWVEVLSKNEDIMWAIIGDVYDAVKTEQEKDAGLHRMGRRPGRSSNSISEVWETIFPAQFSMDPFPLAFEKLLAGRSQRAFAIKVKCSQTTISRLLAGTYPPDMAMLERIATATKVPPFFFVEFRGLWVGHLVTQVLNANPNLGVAAMKRVRASQAMEARR